MSRHQFRSNRGLHRRSLLLLLTTLAASIAPLGLARQIPFHASSSSSYSYNDSARKNDIPTLRLSHEGLSINQPHAPADSSAHSSVPAPAPPELTVYFDTRTYNPADAVVRLGPLRTRSRDQVMLECGQEVGGIESCEADDLAQDADPVLECHVRHGLAPDYGFVLSQDACPGWQDYWHPMLNHRARERDALHSLVVSVSLDGSSHSPPDARWWVGHLHLEKGRASWPLAGNGRARRPGRDDDVTWHPDHVNRISGAMENPYIPRTSDPAPSDVNQGVFVDQVSWGLGVQIRIPTTITNPHLSTSSSATLLPPEVVYAPVGGQVVWSRPHTFRKPPLEGAGAGENDEQSHCLMIRDEWSIVYQIFGLDPDSIQLQEGDSVARGDVLGNAMRDGLSLLPPSMEPPADHPDDKDDKHVSFYPYRYRKLEIRVTRPHRDWTEWKDPDEAGWQYYHPLHAFREGKTPGGQRYRSTIPPYGSPTTVWFGRPSRDAVHVPPSVFASSTDLFNPRLSGAVEVIVGFEYFQQTPGDAGDGMDALGLYAMDLAVVAERDAGDECASSHGWRPLFEHGRMTGDTPVLARYVAAFSYGRFFPERYTSQFDEKARRLFYAPSRTTRGVADLAGAVELRRWVDEPGRYKVVVRGRDYWGNVGCVASWAYIQ